MPLCIISEERIIVIINLILYSLILTYQTDKLMEELTENAPKTSNS
jgi:hypothetical protein